MASPRSALISPAGLADLIERGEVSILDVQFTLDGQAAELYAAAHLSLNSHQCAPHLDLDQVLAGPPGEKGRHPLPSAARLQEGLRAVGLDDDASVVVYDQGTSLGAARAWWVLRWAGLTDVRVLDGGLAAWQRAGLPTISCQLASSCGGQPSITCQLASSCGPGDSAGASAPGTITVRPGSVPVLDVADVVRHLDDGGILLDARTPERFRGKVEPIDTEAGHIPGAVNLPISEVMASDGTFAPSEVIRSALGEHGIRPECGEPTAVATSCGSGITACQLTLALHEAGIASAPFIGSWSEWITDPDRERSTGR